MEQIMELYSSFCKRTSLMTGMLLRATAALGETRVTSNVALQLGSSQQGKALLASVDSNWVTAMCFLVPSIAGGEV